MTMHVKGVGLKFPDGTEQTTAAVGGPGEDTGGSGVYTKDETDVLLSTKANVGVSYTKEEADNIVDDKADIGVSYTKAETEARLATKADITDIQNAVPKGMIMLWSGSTSAIPTGWSLCNGSNGTPDLRDKFVMGAGGSRATTGGSADAVIVSHTHTASTNTTGAHTHSLSGSTNTTGNHAHSYTAPSGTKAFQTSGMTGTSSNGLTGTASATTNTTGNHSHSVSGTANSNGNHTHSVTVNANGTSGTGKNLPPYYALAYIMKTT